MNLKKIHHVAIIVSDYKESREFYVEKLGFRVIRENYRPEREDYKLDLELEGKGIRLVSIIRRHVVLGILHFMWKIWKKSLKNFTRKELKQNQFEKILLQKKE